MKLQNPAMNLLPLPVQGGLRYEGCSGRIQGCGKVGQKEGSAQCDTRDCPRVTLRLSVDDHERLKELAGSMALSTYIRAKALDLDLPRRKPRSSASVVDKQAIAQILGLFNGQC